MNDPRGILELFAEASSLRDWRSCLDELTVMAPEDRKIGYHDQRELSLGRARAESLRTRRKLTPEMVRELRAAPASVPARAFAERWGLSLNSVRDARRGATYRHVT